MSNNYAATSFIVRNYDGNPLVAGARCLHSLNVTVSECLALKDSLSCQRFNHKKLLVERALLLVLLHLENINQTNSSQYLTPNLVV